MTTTDPDRTREPRFTINGERRSFGNAPAHTTALAWLRSNRLTGAKEGCAEGECGACAVLVATSDGDGSAWTAVNSCLVPMAALDGAEVVTSEGLAEGPELHPVQAAMAAAGGSQCGYCTPGFVCSMTAEFYRPGRSIDAATHADAQTESGDVDGLPAADHEHGPNGFDLHALSGNLCRCTGYRAIRDAAYSLGAPGDEPLANRRNAPAPTPEPFELRRGDVSFTRPASLDEATALLAEHDDAVLVSGSTDWGVEVNIRARRAKRIIALDRLPELTGVSFDDDAITIGAATTLSDVERELDGRVPLLAALFPQFASRLIRNRATLGGNLGTGSPIGDSPPALLALDAVLVLASSEGRREVPLAEYFTGYRASVRRPDELIAAIRIPLPLARLTGFHKIAKRRFDDISSVAVGFAVDVEEGVVSRARIGLGGVAATPVRALRTEEFLTGRPWNRRTLGEAARILGAEGTPMSDHRASSNYRSIMLANALLKFGAANTVIEEVDA